jgi:hypothetical protein
MKVEDILKDIATLKQPPGEQPMPGCVITINGDVHNHITINYQRPHDAHPRLIDEHAGCPTTPITHRPRSTRSPTWSNRRAAPRPHQCPSFRPTTPAGQLPPHSPTPSPSAAGHLCQLSPQKPPLHVKSRPFPQYFVPNAKRAGICSPSPQTQPQQAFQPFRQLAQLPKLCANCPPPSQEN